MYMQSIYCIYISNKFNSYSIKLVTLKLYNYNFLEKTIIGRMEKHFIKRLNIVVLNTTSTPIKICSIYAPYIIGLNLNQLTTSKSIVVVYTSQ